LSALPIYYAAAKTSFWDDIKGACKDIVNSFKDTRIWFALGLNDIMARYRGSVLGPFWITLTTAVFVMGIGFLYAGLMKVSIERYLPWMTTGLVIWGLISQTVLEGGDAFISAANILRQTAMPIPLFVWRVVWRNLITFVHQAPVLIAVGLKFHYLFRINLLEASAGLILIVINISWAALFVAIVSARYRDFQQVLASLTQLLFFLSPVLWIPNQMKGYGGKIMMLNPIVHMLNVLRGPLLGEGFSGFSALFLIGTALIGWIITLILFSKVRRRIVHFI
jgi:lipopolysaccharide transport system permease protein